MRRREFITLLGGATAWPLSARAQQPERMRRIGVLMSTAADDPEGQARIAAFHQGLQQLGWTIGHNVRSTGRSSSPADEVRTLHELAIQAGGAQGIDEMPSRLPSWTESAVAAA